MKSRGQTYLYILGGIKHILDIYPELIAFIIVFSLVLWLNLHQDNRVFYYDAKLYWNLRLQFDQQHTVPFSLLNYNESLRSYLLPLIHYSISKTAAYIGMRDVIFLECTQAIVFSGMLTILIPRVIKILFEIVTNFWQIIIFSLLVIFFWQGYFYYPLSDFWALFLFIIGVYVLLGHHSTWWGLILVGMSWGGAFLVRPSYAISIIPLFFWVIFYFCKYLNLNLKQSVSKPFAITLGLAAVVLPQLIINIIHFGIFSPMPQAQLRYGGNLFLKQLSWGIETQRYETFVGPKSDYLPGRVLFIDQHGTNILALSGLGPFPIGASDSFLSLPDYFLLIVKHPLDFCILYLRHLFNGLDVVYNTPYIYDLYENTIHIRIINYSLWFLSILYVSRSIKTSSILRYQFLLLLIFTLPSILSIPTAIEVRFMLPFYFISYSITAFFILPTYFSFSRKEQIGLLSKYLPLYIAFVLACFLLSANTFADLKYGTYIFW